MHNLKSSMIRQISLILAITLFLYVGCSESTQEPNIIKPVVQLNTTIGSIILELDIARAPVSVVNFLDYCEASFYDSTIIHRVIPGFLIQGGQFTRDLEMKEPNDSIICESYNGLSNLRGTIAVARRSAPNSGSCQYFINLNDNPNLDRRDNINLGYTVFGFVIDGIDVVDSIGAVPTSTQQMQDGTSLANVPITPVIVLSALRIK